MNETALTVWCASYPKSGNTWVRALLAGVTGDGTVRLSNLAGSSVGNDQRAIFSEFGITPSVLDDQLANSLMNEVGASIALRSDDAVFRKTHDAFHGYGERHASHILRTPCKAIYIVRDPRAVAVSMAHHQGSTQSEAVELMATGPMQVGQLLAKSNGDRYVTRGCRVSFDWGRWSENVSSWLDQDEVEVSLVRYEDLGRNPEAVVTELVEWLDMDIPIDRIRRAVEESSFERLAMQELFEGFAEAAGPDRHFFRRGQAYGWSDELESGLEDRIIADHSTVMTRLGYLT